MAELESEDKIKIFEQQTKQLESNLNKEVIHWENIIKTCSDGIRGNVKNLPDVDADITNYKQLCDADIRKYALMLHKDNAALKPLRRKRFEFYSTNYQIKVKNSSDIKPLIEADIAKIQYKIDLLDAHIGFLRDTSSNLKSLGYSYKNRLELLNILGLD
jgi:hypothetical protein